MRPQRKRKGDESPRQYLELGADDPDFKVNRGHRFRVQVDVKIRGQRGHMGYQVGMRDDFRLHFSYGALGGGRVAAHDAMVMQPVAGVVFQGNAMVMGKAVMRRAGQVLQPAGRWHETPLRPRQQGLRTEGRLGGVVGVPTCLHCSGAYEKQLAR